MIKTTLPAFVIALTATLLYLFYAQLPMAARDIIGLVPYLLFATVFLLSIFFNQGQLFYLSLASFLSWFLLTHQVLNPQLIELCFVGLVVVICSIGLFAEKGVLTLAAWKIHLLAGLVLGLTYGFWVRQSPWLFEWQSFQLLPVSWFEWSVLSQLSLLLGLICLSGLMALYVWQQQRKTFNAATILIVVFLVFFWYENLLAASLTCGAGLLFLLFATFQKSWHLAYVDELTGLPGRRALEERLQRSLGIYALAMVDVDHFKKFNDTYGHDVGDDVLRMIAAKIGQVKGGGKAYRYGGEEFTIVFNNHSVDEIKEHLQEVIDVVAATPFVVNRRKNQKPKKVQVTVSIGATDSIEKAHAQDTIKVADQALYTAKKKGRNRLQIKK